MTLDKIEDNLKAFLINPMRCWTTRIPVISNYSDAASLIENNDIGIVINPQETNYISNKTLGGTQTIWKEIMVAIEFYGKDVKKREPLVINQKNIELFFNTGRTNYFKVAQLVELKNVNNDWQITNINNEKDRYGFYGSSLAPDLSSNKTYGGYKVKNQNGEHFLYRLRGHWYVLDLSSHLVFVVGKIKGNFCEVYHGGDTFFYEFVSTTIFKGSQYIELESASILYEEEDQEYGDIIRSDVFLKIMDYEEDECPEEKESFEVVVNPSHPYSPVIYDSRFLIATTSPTSTISNARWLAGNKSTNSLNITFPSNSSNAYRAIAYSRDKISGLQQVGNVFGNVISAYDYNGIIDVDGIKYYSYKTKHSYFPISETHEYQITPDPDRDSLIVDYYVGDTGNPPTIDDFSFSNGEIDLDPNRPYYELAIGSDQRSYIALAYTGQIKRILEGINNLRFDFTPSVNNPFTQKVINGKIFNIFISQKTFFEFSSWRIYY